MPEVIELVLLTLKVVSLFIQSSPEVRDAKIIPADGKSLNIPMMRMLVSSWWDKLLFLLSLAMNIVQEFSTRLSQGNHPASHIRHKYLRGVHG
jgi:hypothetical protein